MTMRDFSMMEARGYAWPWFEDLVECDKPLIADGHITVPEAPGLGLRLNADAVAPLLAPGEVYWGD